ncbi:MAG TPA: rRNA maturation RNase YbeY [Kofleriaceae bacterium]|nr:rRNA maturation RNase YbeY [Kofleriaceae bacterium]
MPIDISLDDAVAIPAATLKQLKAELKRMVRAAALTDKRTDYEVALRFCNDREIRVLNRDYRGKDKPTDVLAFAHREGPTAALHPNVLGDIVISVDTAKKQAKRGLHAELLHLASHGLCHLLGYDHNTDEEEAAMNARAAALRAEAKRTGRTRAA